MNFRDKQKLWVDKNNLKIIDLFVVEMPGMSLHWYETL